MNDTANNPANQPLDWGLPSSRGPAPSLMALRALTEQAIPDALFVHDHNGRLIEVNTIACELLGYTREELLSMYVSDVDQDFDLRQGQALWLQLNEGERRAVESRHRHKDGRIFTVRINFGLLHYYGERLYIAVVQDLGKNQQHSAA
jgi:PAS domain S-box-containing protein